MDLCAIINTIIIVIIIGMTAPRHILWPFFFVLRSQNYIGGCCGRGHRL